MEQWCSAYVTDARWLVNRGNTRCGYRYAAAYGVRRCYVSNLLAWVAMGLPDPAVRRYACKQVYLYVVPLTVVFPSRPESCLRMEPPAESTQARKPSTQAATPYQTYATNSSRDASSGCAPSIVTELSCCLLHGCSGTVRRVRQPGTAPSQPPVYPTRVPSNMALALHSTLRPCAVHASRRQGPLANCYQSKPGSTLGTCPHPSSLPQPRNAGLPSVATQCHRYSFGKVRRANVSKCGVVAPRAPLPCRPRPCGRSGPMVSRCLCTRFTCRNHKPSTHNHPILKTKCSPTARHGFGLDQRNPYPQRLSVLGHV